MIEVNGRAYALPAGAPVVGICIDGCDPTYLEAARGVMPQLAAIAARGSAGLAHTVMPSYTNPDEIAILTGAPPDVAGRLQRGGSVGGPCHPAHHRPVRRPSRCPGIVRDRVRRRRIASATWSSSPTATRPWAAPPNGTICRWWKTAYQERLESSRMRNFDLFDVLCNGVV